MGRYSSYGIATFYAIPLADLESVIKRHLYGKSIEDFNPEDLRSLYPANVYDILKTETSVVILLKDCYNGSDIFSLVKDFATITPHKRQLSPEIVEGIGQVINDKPMKDVMELAKSQKYEGFQILDLPEYLYWTPVPVGDKQVYSRTRVWGILIGYSYDKTETEDDTEPYTFLTKLLRYRLKDNPLAPTLLAFLSV